MGISLRQVLLLIALVGILMVTSRWLTDFFGGALLIQIGLLIFIAVGYRREATASPSRVASIITLGLVFIGAWLTFWPSLFLIAWMFFIGDNGSWFYQWVSVIAAALAAILASPLAFRIFRNRADPKYLKICAGTSLLLIAYWGTIYGHEMTTRIQGFSSLAAAERFASQGSELEAVKHVRIAEPHGRGCVDYFARQNGELCDYVKVCPGRGFGWALAHSMHFRGRCPAVSRKLN